MRKLILALLVAATLPLLLSMSARARSADPVSELVERIQKGQSKRFIFELTEQMSPEDFFELDSKGNKIVVRGNNHLSIAAGLNWYLKYHAGIHISWNNPRPRLSNVKFPKISVPERHSTDMLVRYYLNYCTFSYSMAFWNWERWEQEIDWMALHGINLPLSLTGTANVWRNTLLRLGVSPEKINAFIAGPAHQAWWLMNNLEGWGGPNPDSWYDSQARLEKQIVERYREWGMDPVFAGYAGMIPSDEQVQQLLGLETQNPGLWCGYQRPAFLQPTDPNFDRIADIYYEELEKLYGKGTYFAIDPFHEGGSTRGVDLPGAGQALYEAMKRANPGAVWVVQAWGENPRMEMIRDLPGGDVLVLDLFSESRPKWGDPQSTWYQENGYGRHDWVYCMLLNFGGNVGLHGKFQRVIDGYYLARDHANGRHLKGVGTTPEGIENNPVMFELLYELPWTSEKPDAKTWMDRYVTARYGRSLPEVQQAWNILRSSSYNAPYTSTQEGTTESVFCARPALNVPKVSTWGSSVMYYDASETKEALRLMLSASDKYRGCDNYEYDLVDIARQALADQGNVLLKKIEAAYEAENKDLFRNLSDQFLQLILLQDELLRSREEFMVGPWIESAMKQGRYAAEQDFYRWNARVLITTWGNRHAADTGGLHDYSHREWGGLMKDYYYPRWKAFFDALNRGEVPPSDFYPMEADWTTDTNPYSVKAENDPIDTAWKVYHKILTL